MSLKGAFPSGRTSLPDDNTRQGGPVFGENIPTVDKFGNPSNVNEWVGVKNGKRYLFRSLGGLVGVSSTPLISASMAREYLLIQNLSVNDVYLAWEKDAVVDGIGAIKIAADAVYSFSDGFVPANETYAIATGADSLVNYVEAFELK